MSHRSSRSSKSSRSSRSSRSSSHRVQEDALESTQPEEGWTRIDDAQYILYLLRIVVHIDHSVFKTVYISAILDGLNRTANSPMLYRTALKYIYLYLKGVFRSGLPPELESLGGIPHLDEHNFLRRPDERYKDILEEDLAVLDMERINAIRPDHLFPKDLVKSIDRMFGDKYLKPSVYSPPKQTQRSKKNRR